MSPSVLMIAEAVTLAHVGRMLALAGSLHRRGVAVQLALGGAGSTSWETPYPQHRVPGIGAAEFAAALRAGRPVLQRPVLDRMVAADLALLDATRPDLVIGDFRLSLSVSARLRRVPYATLTNAYWSAGCTLPLELPVLPLSRWLPLPVARGLFDVGKSFILPLHCRAMNRCRTGHGLATLGGDLRRVYSDADHVLLADPEGLFPGSFPSDSHHFLGPVPWSPDVALPDWWATLDRRPIVYVSMGSSGDPEVLRTLVQALSALPVQVVASAAGNAVLGDVPHANVHVARYLPGDVVAARSALVVCNGGSMGCQQAAVAGVPVLGVAGNMDQFLNMRAIEAAGAGLLMRADRVDAAAVQRLARRLLDEPAFTRDAAELGRRMSAGGDAGERLFNLLPRLRAVYV